MRPNIKFDYASDTHFMELQEAEIMRQRVELVRDMEEFKGVYYSAEWLRKNILKQSDEEIEEIDKEINAEPDPDDVARVPLGPPPEPEGMAPPPEAAPTPKKNGTGNNNGSGVL